jgi:hypothetical protein
MRIREIALFAAYFTLYWSFLIAHVVKVVQLRKNYHVAARVPFLVALEAIIQMIVTGSVVLRRILYDAGIVFPCTIMVGVSVLTTTTYLIAFNCRATNFYVTFNPAVRKRYLKFVNQKYIAPFALSFLVFPIVAMVLWQNFPHPCISM